MTEEEKRRVQELVSAGIPARQGFNLFAVNFQNHWLRRKKLHKC